MSHTVLYFVHKKLRPSLETFDPKQLHCALKYLLLNSICVDVSGSSRPSASLLHLHPHCRPSPANPPQTATCATLFAYLLSFTFLLLILALLLELLRLLSFLFGSKALAAKSVTSIIACSCDSATAGWIWRRRNGHFVSVVSFMRFGVN